VQNRGGVTRGRGGRPSWVIDDSKWAALVILDDSFAGASGARHIMSLSFVISIIYAVLGKAELDSGGLLERGCG